MNQLAAVVGYECMTPLGVDLRSSWEGAVAARSGITAIQRYSPGSADLRGIKNIHCAGQLPITLEELAGSKEALVKWPEPAYHAARLVTRRLMSRLGTSLANEDPERIGVLGATALTSQISQGVVSAEKRPTAYFILNQCQNIPLAAVAIEHKLRGPSYSTNSACASSNHALYNATLLITRGVLDAALIIAFEFPVVPICVAGFDWMNALYRWADRGDPGFADPGKCSRPFSVDRRGFVLAEGVAAVMLASLDLARKHDWSLEAIIAGGHMNNDALHMTSISRENVAACMRGALRSARCSPDEVGCVNAHATSTKIGDGAELLALSDVFGASLPHVPIVANKSQFGHSLGASGALELIFAIEGMKRGVLLPTLNYREDPSLPRARVHAAPETWLHRVTLLNSFGFGGTNACLLVARP
jgi:3-oxoacyl-[acyl-carrier-protein] synthase II